MIDSAHEKDARQEVETGQAGTSARAVQRRAKEGVGRGEEITEEMISAGFRALSLISDPTASASSMTVEELVGVYIAMRSAEPGHST